MPKTRRRKKEPARKSTQSTPGSRNNSVRSTATTGAVPLNRPFLSPGVRGPQSLIWPAMVALGCWGMAFSFFVFSTDPNHVLFAGLGVLMALLWSFSLAIRIRKLLVLRQKSVGARFIAPK